MTSGNRHFELGRGEAWLLRLRALARLEAAA